ncbi:hypothetical protein [Natrinema caseinilyticum]|uniref:hypothetical protein n=1 Tax=Natrinema caseinilyticum TaxID=2961570 RepID=UPI0020C4D121|nr:hypothetical protein [Natrinema caseinilyticum]
MDRRTILAGTGLAFSAAFAGCSERETAAENENDDTLDNQGNDTDQDNERKANDTQEEERTDAEDDEDNKLKERPDIILPEEAKEHLDVLNHELDSNGTGCEFHVELERVSSDDKYHVSFETEVTLYSDDGETIGERSGPSVGGDNLEQGESRIYSISFDDCEGADQYTFEIVNFSVVLFADAVKADVEIHPNLEDKLEVSHEFSWVGEPGSGQCRITIRARNVTQDHVISATVNSDDLDLGFTALEPGKVDTKKIEGSCTNDVERYLVRIGTSDHEIEENDLINEYHEEIDAAGEVVLPENAKEHLVVRDHALVRRNPDQDGCEVRVELKKTSADKYHLSFGSEVELHSDTSEYITGRLGFREQYAQLEENESRVYSTSFDGYEGAPKYGAELVRFDAFVHADDLKPDFDLDPELEGKLEITDHSISFEESNEYAPVYDAEMSRKSATVKNITEKYRLSVTGPDGEYHEKTVDLEPGETADFTLTGWQYSANDETYGFSIEAVKITEINNS